MLVWIGTEVVGICLQLSVGLGAARIVVLLLQPYNGRPQHGSCISTLEQDLLHDCYRAGPVVKGLCLNSFPKQETPPRQQTAADVTAPLCRQIKDNMAASIHVGPPC